jgi:predicted flap endonuclease-1-like 5' DNA nuclease
LAERDAEIKQLESRLTTRRTPAVVTDAGNPTLFAPDTGETNEPGWRRGVTALGTPGDTHHDDLRVINGVGKKLQKVLNGFGIQSWEQVAGLTPEEVTRVDDALDFPGRIERDQWVEQARDLVARFPDRANRPSRETFLNEQPE